MKEIQLKYGCNPNQDESKIYMKDGSNLPIEILNGRPGYINLLDAFNSYQLVRELKLATNLPAAASFKHVSPTSAAVGKILPERLKKSCFVDDIQGLDESLLACAYARARGTDRMCSFGDFVALSDRCDALTAKLIKREQSDGIIAPDYDKEALEILKQKKKGNYLIIKIDKKYIPAKQETKEVFGITFEQAHNDCIIAENCLKNIVTAKKELPESAKIDLLVSLITLKYTQSNSICYAYDGQAIGVGAGQQSRIHCTRLAGTKADTWYLRQTDKVLNLPFKDDLKRVAKDNVIENYINPEEADVCAEGVWQQFFTTKPEPFTAEEKKKELENFTGVSLGSDGFIPFDDNIRRASLSGVKYIAQPGGSVSDSIVIKACDNLGIVMTFTGIRLFHH